MSNTKQKKSPLQILLRVIIIVALVLVLFFSAVRLYFRLPVRAYYKLSEKGFVIPGLKDGFIPQGLDYDETTKNFFVTGYTKDGSASPVYVVSEDGSLIATSPLRNADGSDHTGHAGGLAINGPYTYVAGGHDCCLYVFSTADILAGKPATALGTFDLGHGTADEVGVAFVTIHDNELIAGEFYRDPNYLTVDSHKLTTTGGDYNQAVAVSYPLSDAEGSIYGICPEPTAIWSLPDLVQGMTIYQGKAYLSTSYGVAKSVIYSYDLAGADHGKTINLWGQSYPLLELDSNSLVQQMNIAPMSEEIVFKDGKMYTMCESASNKYIFGKFTSGKYCYATTME